ncbi:MAG TPA: protein-L-isoaspartate(D-aspartate) O-methyltransferase [Planctomycetota bacterium]|nr:protein-L-isoaspartate(D-aspartate) O-methyltransferase [Planctomycetota bacterium]
MGSKRLSRILIAVAAVIIEGGCDGRGKPDGAARLEDEYALARERMVAELEATGGDAPITDSAVLRALSVVPRHEFVPEAVREKSYENHPLPLPENQTISQPYIVALMTQLLELKGTEKVLEIGTGSGYQAAILGELASEVYTVEIRPNLLETARAKLEDLRSRGILHHRKLVTIAGDGSKGYEPGAPYDAIIVTAAPRKIPAELLSQLKPGGRLVVPVGDFFQELQLIRKKEDGSSIQESIVPVRFVPLMNDAARPDEPR